MTTQTDVRHIVIIGASFAGLTVAQSLLKDVIPQLSSAGKNERYQVVMVSPSEDLYWKIGSPRTIVNPKALPVEKALIPIAPYFSKYSAEKYRFIKAHAKAIDHASKTVQLSTSEALNYDFLVICSGTYFKSDVWSTTPGSDALRAAIQDMHQRIPAAESILVGGGGPAGVETAGELGETYGGKKTITLLSGQNNLLGKLQNQAVGKTAQAKLENMGVKVINDSIKVVSCRHEGGKDVLELSNGETKTVDVYIEATGDLPNSSFVPHEWLDQNKKVKTDPQTLRLSVPGVTGVYCYGSVGSYSNGSLFDVMMAKKAITESIRLDLTGQGTGARTKNVYKKWTSDMQMVPIGSAGGVGVAFNYSLPSFMVKMVKSKDYMIGQATKYLDGSA